jgi:hypothetical protein
LQLRILSIAAPSGRLLRDLYGENGAVRLKPPAEASVQQMVVDSDCIFRQPRDLSDHCLGQGGRLGADPDVAATLLDMDRAVASIVVISDLPMLSIVVIQERVATLSTCTVQAPQSAMQQPNFVPVMPSTSQYVQERGVAVDRPIGAVDLDRGGHDYLHSFTDDTADAVGWTPCKRMARCAYPVQLDAIHRCHQA